MTTVRFDPDSLGGYQLRCRYDAGVVFTIKNVVPGYARSYDPPTKVWTIYQSGWAAALAAALCRAGHEVSGIHVEPPQPPGNGAATDGWADQLFRRVGPGRSDLVYRMLSRALHPDVGGNTQLMQELNQARERANQKGTQP